MDEFGPRLAFFFNGHNNVFQEVAKFRAVRRMWARIMRERFGSENPKSQTIRFHTQTGGVTLAAQQPENNIVRVALQGFAAVCGGTQSLHTNGFDEALALPTEKAARIALRTQQILAHESGATDTVDPFAGSYFVEALTDEIEARAQELIDRIDEMGGSVECIPFIRAEVEESAWSYEQRYKQKQDIVVGVNEFVSDEPDDVEILRVDPESERQQVERLKKFKADRDQEQVAQAARGAAPGRQGHGQPARADPRRAEGPRDDRRGLRRDARRVRRVQGGVAIYDASVAVHVMAAIVAFGPLFAFPLFISVTERRDRLSLPVVLRGVNRTERALVIPAGAVVGFTGVYQAIDGPFAFDRDEWMTIGFVLYLLVFGVLVLLVEPLRAQAADEADRLLADAGDDDHELPLSEAYRAKMRLPNVLMPAVGVVLLFVVYLMEVKPG